MRHLCAVFNVLYLHIYCGESKDVRINKAGPARQVYREPNGIFTSQTKTCQCSALQQQILKPEEGKTKKRINY